MSAEEAAADSDSENDYPHLPELPDKEFLAQCSPDQLADIHAALDGVDVANLPKGSFDSIKQASIRPDKRMIWYFKVPNIFPPDENGVLHAVLGYHRSDEEEIYFDFTVHNFCLAFNLHPDYTGPKVTRKMLRQSDVYPIHPANTDTASGY